MTLADALRRDNSPSPPHPRLFLVTDYARLPDPIGQIQRLPPGSCVIFRHYEAPDRDVAAKRIARLCRIRRLVLLIAGDLRLAVRLGADGIHLPEHMARSGRNAPLRLWAKTGKIISAAAHSRTALIQAAKGGAHFCLLSPAFATASHPGAAGLGPLRFAVAAGHSPVPVIALGGMTAKTWARLPPGSARGAAAAKIFP